MCKIAFNSANFLRFMLSRCQWLGTDIETLIKSNKILPTRGNWERGRNTSVEFRRRFWKNKEHFCCKRDGIEAVEAPLDAVHVTGKAFRGVLCFCFSKSADRNHSVCSTEDWQKGRHFARWCCNIQNHGIWSESSVRMALVERLNKAAAAAKEKFEKMKETKENEQNGGQKAG